MREPSAIKGTFSDFRIVKTRKLAQLVIEIPIEQADAALITLGGLPRSDSERWVAIALLDMRASNAPPNSNPEAIAADKWSTHMKADYKRRFCDLPLPAQAGIKSEDLEFWLWISKTAMGKECENAADAIRGYCGVTSRKDIIPGSRAAERWHELLRAFEERNR